MANRLAAEPSPYLQQHSDNPVDWFPWGPEALSLAAERDVPILLSIGYSSCHWCHVMAHESFEDASTAAYMNEHFVCIKVDREERPDIDAIYLEAAQAMSGHGGWPLTAFLAPNQVPFFAGTYFPPQPRPNMPSFRQLMESIVDVWTNHRAQVDERSELVAQQLVASAQLAAPDEPVDPAVLDAAVDALRSNFDHENGGFGLAPKFPPHSVTEFLLGRADGDGRELALETLRAIAAGGIHDHVAGGFARYSVDAQWRVPHFEKMLYDNALLARSFLHAFRATGDDAFAETARSTLDWMLEDLRGEDGGFSSALDADSMDADGALKEGAFYTWSAAELRDVVGQAAGDEAEALLTYWGISEHGVLEGRNVLAVVAPEAKPSDAAIIAARGALKQLRATRPSPAIDDKRLAAWNALAVSALAEAGAVLREPRYTSAALDCAEFIERELSLGGERLRGGRLRRSSTRGTPGPAGFLEDHAFVAAAYLTLHEVTSDEKWFLRAREIADAVIDHFEDAEHGGFFSVAGDQEQLIVRRKDIEDNPIPSGNSAAALMLLRIAALTGEQRYRVSATRALQVALGIAGRLPLGFGHVLEAIAFHAGPVDEVALVGPPAQREALLEVVLGDFRPRLVIAAGDGDSDSAVPLLASRPALDGHAAAYVCHDFTCGLPTTDPNALAEQLAAGTP